MKTVIIASLSVLTVALGGCSSSGSSDDAAGTPSCDAACESLIQEAGGNATPAPAEAQPITDGYDTATCADWAVTAPADQLVVALYYATKYNDPQPDQDADSLVKIITTTCDSYGAKETPAHAAKVSIASVYGGN